MEQQQFDAMPKIKNVNEPHMALVLLLDVSGSMAGEPINELIKGVNRFKDEVCQDEQTKKILDVSVISFSNDYNVIQDFVPIEDMHKIELTADGATYYNGPISKAIDLVTERSRLYRQTGTEPYKPWIIMVTDGAPMDDNIADSISKINNMVENQKLKFWSLAVEGADTELLHKLSGPCVLTIKDHDFSTFFNWVNKSMRAVSQSSPGQNVTAPALPDNVALDNAFNC